MNGIAEAKGHYFLKNVQNSCHKKLTNIILRKTPAFLHVMVLKEHTKVLELVKNNLFFFNIFIDMLHNKNTSVKYISTG